MGGSSDSALIGIGLGEVWERNRGLIAARLLAIELGTVELLKQRPETAAIEAGRDAAHKLAGVLGSFGLPHGTELARNLEQHLAGPRARQEAERLNAIAAELRRAVERRD